MIHNQLIIADDFDYDDEFADDFDYNDDDKFADDGDIEESDDDDEEASWYLTGRQPMVKSLASSKNVSNSRIKGNRRHGPSVDIRGR